MAARPLGYVCAAALAVAESSGLEPLAYGDSNSSNGLHDGGYWAVKHPRRPQIHRGWTPPWDAS